MTKPLNILLIEDNEGDREYIGEILLRSPGVQYKGVGTLREGIEELNNYKYDVVLLDLYLPDVHGEPLKAFFELESRFKEGDPLAIVIITGLNDLDTSTFALRSGAQDFFEKGELNINNQGLIRAIIRANERALHLKSKLDKAPPPNNTKQGTQGIEESLANLNELKRRFENVTGGE